ncbi:hypothetical protein MJT46_009342 [Ovis ammon polii x Ovis aries]|nr:hypothetical protein MJT46_009342 [Ovis ammon polii x Ovis aries]
MQNLCGKKRYEQDEDTAHQDSEDQDNVLVITVPLASEGPTEWPQITYQNTRQNFNKEKFLSRHSSVGFDSPSAKGEKKHVDPDHVL